MPVVKGATEVALRIGLGTNQFGESCSVPEYRDAVRVAASLNIPILKFDFTKEYKEKVLDYMFREYSLGRTPNPDVLCNKFVKFGVWLNKARELGFDYLATGHYARLREIKSQKSKIKTFQLLEARDKNKDQTYFLHQFTQEQLRHVLFPIGNLTKPEVRKLAKKFNLPVANKEESMGICFIGEVSMKDFLQQRIKPKTGNILMSSGEIIGKHDGLPFYTIGQRHIGSIKYQVSSIKDDISVSLRGDHSRRSQRSSEEGNLPIPEIKPLYVVAKHIKTNELIVGYEDDPLLYKEEIEVGEINWVSGQPSSFPLQCQIRLRHRQKLQKCIVYPLKNDSVQIKFFKPERAVTPGQFSVLYFKGECLGGGVII
jgi:tRNA-specific 2-thiouridylase